MSTPLPITHECPPFGTGVTPCCGKTPFELPRTDRLTVERVLVTCTGAVPESAQEWTRPLTLPCGCVLNAPDEAGEVRMDTCRNDCPSIDVLAEIFAEVGKPVEYRDA